MGPLQDIMGVEEASVLWDLSPGYIKNLCANDLVECKKIGGTWVLDKNQSSPKKVKSSTLLNDGLND
ncbi:hypothetical protein GH741_02445 [Aquibacillus halophilus]|uniref:Helix-turn-helix domain-containing protein n=1 Tax=Aquibacillus halophilus TaxID=930132 RepID=A0A6A8DJV7_9BACI|nr:helix-turn-helix domain-containing protein [Aquibacillus halophilus]MRH41532.1 hypothetical protein [Aquibacillus halophilus]